MSADDVPDFSSLAWAALQEKLDLASAMQKRTATTSEATDAAALVRAESDARVQLWTLILDRAEKMVDKLANAMKSGAVVEAAKDVTPTTTTATAKPDDDEATKTAAILDALTEIGKRPPPDEAARILLGIGATADNLPGFLDDVRRSNETWPVFLDEEPEWVAEVLRLVGEQAPGEATT